MGEHLDIGEHISRTPVRGDEARITERAQINLI
jgi:hypothetical protein